ncbi:uncharacterized protein LOC133175982 [Saccostrea echinata]|uniref:uncharacterized protein LOC133175982 n=1 Tax=Saccostrea echinata TaxID=191078 RepID=UPI002A7F7E23|nr:uncharacterized protein LOC133175982 [Saccostrea echinata]XP_061167128.1 uncharacterized protein LOC133175982 [Saccostrea echinata]
MAMLAEPRFKRKISINPNGNAWSNDDTKFGQKLMKKYGWTEGKGLGVKEDGNPEHVKVDFKFGNKGVGYKHNHSDNWIAHQDDFNAILANLNEGSTGEPASVSSIESTSKKSRSRVHYQKFVQGKDLSRRSASDLDSIFGVRSNKKTKEMVKEDDITEDKPKEDPVSVVTFNSTDSLQEYFAKKMAAKKGGNQQKELETVNEQDSGENGSTLEKEKKKKKKRKADPESSEEKACERTEDEHVMFSLGDNESGSKVKKAKKSKSVEAVESGSMFDDSNIDDSKKFVKKSKKSKRKGKEESVSAEEKSVEIVESNEIKDDSSECVKKSRKSKKKEREITVPSEENVISGDNECAKESKKEKVKKRGKQKLTEERVETIEKVPVKRQLENADEEEGPKSKKKKSKQGELGKSGTTDGRAKRVVFDSEGNFERVHEVEDSSVEILKESYMKTFMPNYTEKLKAGSKVKRTSVNKTKKKMVKSLAEKPTAKLSVKKTQKSKTFTEESKQTMAPARNARKTLPNRQLDLLKSVGENKMTRNSSGRKKVPFDRKASPSARTVKRLNEKRTVQNTLKKDKSFLSREKKRKILEQDMKTKLPSIIDVFKSKGASVHAVGGLYEKPIESGKQDKSDKGNNLVKNGKNGGKNVKNRNSAKKGKKTVSKENSAKLLTKNKGQAKNVKKTSSKPKALSDVEKEKIEQIRKRTGKTLTRHQLKKSLWYAKQKFKT